MTTTPVATKQAVRDLSAQAAWISATVRPLRTKSPVAAGRRSVGDDEDMGNGSQATPVAPDATERGPSCAAPGAGAAASHTPMP